MSENHLLLENRDYTFIFARSLVSWSPSHPYYEHWLAAQTKIIDLAKCCQSLDNDGITVYLASSPFIKHTNTEVVKLAQLFQIKDPPETMDLVSSLQDAIDDYFQRRDAKQTQNGDIILVLVDQISKEQESLSNLIINATEKIDLIPGTENSYELGISFLQIGEDPATKEFLTYLDDRLVEAGAKCDIVDTKFWYEIKQKSLVDILIHALVD
ncbi:MAG: hypothetical protein F6K40_06660 [Okeania sp. SIO3I5]|uniref:hypothetical protein n=1 Tax=Okeania sp. SIO3I5 TaxID=2607805 RepID=UPI0013BE3A89|nr:hypothetical protein [Okeania sp. SIO3I5]NEQ35982.1 hypothetical protein [Okeania sp. SIO3I5]